MADWQAIDIAIGSAVAVGGKNGTAKRHTPKITSLTIIAATKAVSQSCHILS
jgi:hypothetical protein